MNTREQLEEILLKLTCEYRAQVVKGPDGENLIGAKDFAVLLEKLIAERPYEPGETILVGPDEEKATFLCVDYQYPDWVWADTRNGLARCWRLHKPLPKTYRVTVPEEIMEDAKDARKAFCLVAESPSEVKGFKALEWLANPDNWEK